jgi:glycosyltransferase involved in cell wall biosynthesis
LPRGSDGPPVETDMPLDEIDTSAGETDVTLGEGDVSAVSAEPEPPADNSVTIGYLSRICPTKGLHQLAEAFTILLKSPNLPPVRLVAAGCLDRGDRAYLKQIRRLLAERGLVGRFRYLGRLDRAAKIAFLRSLDVLSIPSTRPEARGLAVLEGWANGVPTVLPDHGAFSELTAATGGGLLVEPNRPTKLAAALARLIEDPALAERCGRQAQEVIRRDYDIRVTAGRIVELYRSLHPAQPDSPSLTPTE